VRLLGLVGASLDGRDVALGEAKQTVLAVLALRVNTPVSADRLIEGLWGERPPASAGKMVQLYVSQLRRLLDGGDAEIVTRGRGYELRLPSDAVDAVRFERLLDEQEGAAEALRLWRGAPLDDLADEPFAAAEIRRLEELWLRARELAIDAELEAGEDGRALGEIDELVAAHPLRERLHAQRMLALYRSGRQAEALEAYREARDVLVREVGVEPGPELRRLHEAILQFLGSPGLIRTTRTSNRTSSRRRQASRTRRFRGRPCISAQAATHVGEPVRWRRRPHGEKTRTAFAEARVLAVGADAPAWDVHSRSKHEMNGRRRRRIRRPRRQSALRM
jgi:DNA-binding SARP family transcriptional activator